MHTRTVHSLFDELTKIGAVSEYILKKLLKNPAVIYGRTERHSQASRLNDETMRALDKRNPYPAGWAPLGMRPRR